MKNIIISLAIQLFNVILLILNRLIFSNYLGIEEYGIYTTLSLYANIFVMIGSLGLGHSLSYMVNNNLITKSSIYSYVLRITIFSSILILPIGYVYLILVYSTIPSNFVVLILLSVPFLLFINLMIYSFLEDGKTIRFFLFNSFHILISIGLYLIFDKNLIYAFIGWTLGSIISFLLLNMYLMRDGYSVNFKKINTGSFSYLKYGIKIFANTLINTMNSRLSLFIASILLTFEYVAILSITILITDLFNKVFHTFSLIIMSKNNENRFPRYLFSAILLTSLGLISLYFMGDYFIKIFFPNEYLNALVYFWYLIPFIFLNGIYGLYYHLLVKQDKTQLGILAAFLNLLSLLILGIFLTSYYEIYGLLLSLNISSLIGLTTLITMSYLSQRRGEKTF